MFKKMKLSILFWLLSIICSLCLIYIVIRKLSEYMSWSDILSPTFILVVFALLFYVLFLIFMNIEKRS